MRKQLDPRIPALINNGVKSNHRSFFVMVGDRGRDQVVNLHFLLSQSRVTARPNVLWCYKKELGFTTYALGLDQLEFADMVAGIGRSGKPRSNEMSSVAFARSMSRIHSSSSLRSRTSAIPTTRILLRFWVKHLACWCCRTMRLSPQIFWLGQSRQ